MLMYDKYSQDWIYHKTCQVYSSMQKMSFYVEIPEEEEK